MWVISIRQLLESDLKLRTSSLVINPMAFNRRIPSLIVAFLRVRRCVVHYASMQFRP